MNWFTKLFKKNEIVASSANYPDGFNGEKYPGGTPNILNVDTMDYYELRRKSSNLFNTNSYAKGFIRRLVTNIINTGLQPELTPVESILGFEEGFLTDWSEENEIRFDLWANSAELCDYKGQRTFYQIQADAEIEAHINGDVLVVLRQDKNTSLPQIQLIPGDRVETPWDKMEENIVDGVKLDANNRHLGYYVLTDDGKHTYIEARGRRTGRLNAFLYYGVEKREDAVRGMPALAVAIQALSEIDAYRDSAQRKAHINAMIVGFIERTEDRPSSRSLSTNATRKGTATVSTDGEEIGFNEIMNGLFMQSLQPGEKASPYSTQGTDINFPQFESAIIAGLCWAMEVPPEIMLLSFNSNYSASQAANNEFKIFLNKRRARHGAEFSTRVFEEYFLSQVLLDKIWAPGFLDAYRDPTLYDIKRAWLAADWIGAIKPSTDIVKTHKGYKGFVEECWLTNERASRETTGTKFSNNVRRLKRENQLKMEAIQPVLEAKKLYGETEVDKAVEAMEGNRLNVVD